MVFFSPLGEPVLNPYTILNLEFGASDDDIGKAYKKLMLQLHPDKQPADQTEEEAAEVSRRFHDVMDAKSFLLDGEHLANRREYDARLVAAEKAKAAMEAKAAAEAKAQAQREAALAAQAKAQSQQKQSAPSTPLHTSSDKVKNHHSDDTKPESSPSKSKSAAPSKSEDSKADTTLKKPNLTKKQWGRVNRPTRRVQPEKEKPSSSSEPHKYDRKNSCSTTSEDSSSDDEGPQHHRGRSHTPRSKPKKSKTTSDKPTAKKSSSSKKASDKNKVKEKSDDKAKPRSHAVTSKSTRRGSDDDKPTGGKKSASKKTSKTETAKQRSKSTSANNQKLSASCHSFFDDDDKKNRSHSYERKNSYDGKTSSADKSPRKSSMDATPSNKATPSPTATSNKTTSKASAPTSHFSAFQPAVDNLTKQYECPLTKEVMNEPMTDFEGNHYERDAIMKYLETHSTSPVTGNPLYPMFLTPNTALKERIKYTLKLKSTLDTLTFHENPVSSNDSSQKHVVTEQCQFKPLSLRHSVDMFIKELNAGSPNGIISRLDSSGNAPFTYNGLEFTLQVPEGLSSNILLQTWFDHDRKAAGISARVVEWNRSLQEIGLGGKLTFRNIKGKFAFTLTREMKPEKFSKKELKHAIEYYLEMSIKLHNTINVSDQRKVDKVRLQDSCLAQQ